MSKPKETDEIQHENIQRSFYDGRKEFTQIAQEAKFLKDVIWTHFIELKKKFSLGLSTIQLDYKNVGYDGAASFLIDDQRSGERENAKKLDYQKTALCVCTFTAF